MAADAVGGNGMVQSTLSPPVLKGDVFLGPVRWQVAVPPGWVALYQGGGYTSEQSWERRGALWAPHPAATGAELERWLGGSEEADRAAALPGIARPSAVCWRTGLQPLHVVHVPQQVWLLACSLVFLVFGLAAALAPVPRGLLWAGLIVVGLAAAVAAICWPSVLPAVIYGCEPGAVALVAIVGVQWMLQRRYRRQVVFLPGFTRRKSGSSLIRGNGSARPRGEPSTVDAPVPPVPSPPGGGDSG